jgi:hypothetical protein
MMALRWGIVSGAICNRTSGVATGVMFWPYRRSARVCGSDFYSAGSIVYALGSIVALPLKMADRQIPDGTAVGLANGITISLWPRCRVAFCCGMTFT